MKLWCAALLLLLVCGAFAPREASAATTCSATVTDVDFGANVDPVAGASTTATLNYSCTTSGVSSGTSVRVLACFSIGDGSAGDATTINPRRMTQSGTNPPYLYFNLFTNAAATAIWGTFWQAAFPPPQVSINRTGNGTTTGSLPVYGRVQPNQTTITPGAYGNTFNGGHFNLDYRYREGSGTAPTDCRTGGGGGTTTAGGTFAVRATVPADCEVTAAGDMAFASPVNLLTSNIDQTSTLSLTCTNGANYQIGLDNGGNAVGTQRRMRLGTTGNYVAYELYRNVGRTQRWGGTLNTDTTAGTGSGTSQSVTVYGRVPVQSPMPAAGAYKDTILVTVTY